MFPAEICSQQVHFGLSPETESCSSKTWKDESLTRRQMVGLPLGNRKPEEQNAHQISFYNGPYAYSYLSSSGNVLSNGGPQFGIDRGSESHVGLPGWSSMSYRNGFTHNPMTSFPFHEHDFATVSPKYTSADGRSIDSYNNMCASSIVSYAAQAQENTRRFENCVTSPAPVSTTSLTQQGGIFAPNSALIRDKKRNQRKSFPAFDQSKSRVSVGIQYETEEQRRMLTLLFRDCQVQTDFSDTLAGLSLLERPSSFYRVDMAAETGSIDNEACSTDECDSDSGYSSWRYRQAMQADCCCFSASANGDPAAAAAATCWYHHHHGPHVIDESVMLQSDVHPERASMPSRCVTSGYDEFTGNLVTHTPSVNFDVRWIVNDGSSATQQQDDVIKSFDTGTAMGPSNGVQLHDWTQTVGCKPLVSDGGSRIAAGYSVTATARKNDLQITCTAQRQLNGKMERKNRRRASQLSRAAANERALIVHQQKSLVKPFSVTSQKVQQAEAKSFNVSTVLGSGLLPAASMDAPLKQMLTSSFNGATNDAVDDEAGDVIKMIRSGCDVIPGIHGRFVREYCNHLLSEEIDESCWRLLSKLSSINTSVPSIRHQTSRRRLVVGLNEVPKQLRIKHLQCVIIAPNIERIQSKGGLDDVVSAIIESCEEQGVSFCFALGRKALGQSCGKCVPVSVVGIFSCEEVQEDFANLVKLVADARAAYRRIKLDLDERTSQPTPTSSSSGTSKICGIKDSDIASPTGCFGGNAKQNVMSSSSSYSTPEIDDIRTVCRRGCLESSEGKSTGETRGVVGVNSDSIIKHGGEMENQSVDRYICEASERVKHASRSDPPFPPDPPSCDVTTRIAMSSRRTGMSTLAGDSERMALTSTGTPGLSAHRLVREIPWHETGYRRSGLVSTRRE